jgi:hypothetical protein
MYCILYAGFGFYVDGDGNMVKKPQVDNLSSCNLILSYICS